MSLAFYGAANTVIPEAAYLPFILPTLLSRFERVTAVSKRCLGSSAGDEVTCFTGIRLNTELCD
jgi:hypothetical protein